MSGQPTIWTVLGIDETMDAVAIRRAYAKRLKQDRPADAHSFQMLRSAYEMALRHAYQKAQQQSQQMTADKAHADAAIQPRPETATEISSPQATTNVAAAQPAAQPVDESTNQPVEQHDELNAQLGALGHSFQQLYQSLKAGNEQAARRHFDDILSSAALERIDIEHRVEYELAQLLAATLPASDVLLDAVIKRFGWDNQKVNARVTPAMIAILNRRRDVEFRRTITYSGHPYRSAYDGLRTRTLALFRWIKAHYHLFGRATEHQLLQHVRREYPSLISDFDPQIVAWLDRMASRPQPSFVLIGVFLGMALLSLLASLYGLFLGTTSIQKTLYSQLQILGAGAVTVAAWLLLIDWPRMMVRKKWPKEAPWYLRAGWMLMLVAVLLTSAIMPDNKIAFISMVLLTVISASWCAIFTERFWVPHNNFSGNILVVTLLTNVPLLYWWLFLGQQMDFKMMATPMIAVMTLSVITAGPLASNLQQKMTATQRIPIALIMLFLSALTIKAVWEMSKFTAYYSLCVALTFALVAISRPFNVLLLPAQRAATLLAGFVGCMIFFSVAESPDVYVSNPTIVGGAFAFCAMIFVSTSMLIFNELRILWKKPRLQR